MSTANTDVVRRFFEAWGRQDLETAAGQMTPDFVNNSSTSQGREGVIEEGRFWFSAFPDARVSIEELLSDGDKVTARLTTTATHQGEFLGTPPTGRQVTIGEIDVFRIENGLIAEAWAAPDLFALLMQIGALGEPSPA